MTDTAADEVPDEDAMRSIEAVVDHARPDEDFGSGLATTTAAPEYEASPAEVHIARTWLSNGNALWGPRCDPGAFWTVPLISANEWVYSTCLRCRSLGGGSDG